jgi:two-component system OmpR family response regulator
VKILLADDEEMILNLYRDMLEGNGHRVETVNNGLGVLDSISVETFDLLILDLHMPKMDGFKTLLEMKERNQQLPVIVMTGHYPDDVVKDRIGGLGVVEVLRKPVMITVLQHAVDRVGGVVQAT